MLKKPQGYFSTMFDLTPTLLSLKLWHLRSYSGWKWGFSIHLNIQVEFKFGLFDKFSAVMTDKPWNVADIILFLQHALGNQPWRVFCIFCDKFMKPSNVLNISPLGPNVVVIIKMGSCLRFPCEHYKLNSAYSQCECLKVSFAFLQTIRKR